MNSKYCAWTKASIAGKPEELFSCDTENTVAWFNNECEFPENMFKIKLFLAPTGAQGVKMMCVRASGILLK